MGEILSFTKRPAPPGEDWPWPVLKEIIENAVKRSPALPEDAPEAVSGRMKPDVLRWVSQAQEISSGIRAEETRDQLVTFFAEVFTDRILAEMKELRERRA